VGIALASKPSLTIKNMRRRKAPYFDIMRGWRGWVVASGRVPAGE
jgi:hypothetical protein